PNGIAIVPLPQRDVNGTVQDRLAFRVGANLPITVYQFNPLQNEQVFSTDASLLLPTDTAGDKYYVMTREQTFDLLKGYFTVIGITDEPTLVTVRVTARTLAGPGIPELYPDDEYMTVLGRYEVLNIETNEIGADLTGSLITASGPVVAFGGSEAANAPYTSRCDRTGPPPWRCAWDGVKECTTDADCSSFITCCADHLEEQLFPVAAWGNEYVGVRSMPRGNELDVWRVMAGSDDTQVVVQPPLVQIPVLDEGRWFEFETGEDFLLVADKPVLLAQFLAAEHAPNPNPPLVNYVDGDAGTGDPAMMLAVPTRQFLDKYVFLAPADVSANKFYEKHYVSIAAPAGASVRLGVQEVGLMDPLVDELQVRDIPGTTWRAYRVRIAAGFHTLACTQPCSVMVHGYDQYVSYGYPGGLGLEDEPQPVE
ncbi:MAG: IgGFc-binding protein, partial [Deltaproteobacteria bacterium]|nr:IgGFc-binding protein [Deltaproteobacteria bacterium]